MKKGIDQENVMFNGELQHKGLSTFKKMACLTIYGLGIPVVASLEPIATTDLNANTFPQKKALEDSSVHVDNLLVKRFKVTDVDVSSRPVVGADD